MSLTHRFRPASLILILCSVSAGVTQVSPPLLRSPSLSLHSGSQTGPNSVTFACSNPRLQTPTDPSSKHTVLLSWKASVSLATPLANGEGYNLYRLNPDGSCTKTNATLIQGTSYQDHFVELGKTYHYTTKAVNRKGESGPSNVVEVSIPRT
jgi:hypothetical protein